MKRILIFLIVAFGLFLTGCQSREDTVQHPLQEAQEPAFLISNLADPGSRAEVETVLKKVLPEQNVDHFLADVLDYNETICQTSLTQGFEKAVPEYDMAKISSLWTATKGTFIGLNCRITAFQLLLGALQSQKGASDGALLFLDYDAISSGKLFSDEETEQFTQLFSRVKTEKTEDIKVHADKMREHFSLFTFPENVKMVSVVLNDNLDGAYLFIGHVGVLVEDKGEFLFIEKLSFEEPYQALKFRRAEDCYQYLLKKYENYTDEGAAKPFIMVNGEFECGNEQ